MADGAEIIQFPKEPLSLADILADYEFRISSSSGDVMEQARLYSEAGEICVKHSEDEQAITYFMAAREIFAMDISAEGNRSYERAVRDVTSAARRIDAAVNDPASRSEQSSEALSE